MYSIPTRDKDPIINGGPLIWPDGTTFTSIATATYGPEMWRYVKVGAGVHDLLQSTDVPALSTALQKMSYSIHLDVTTADASIAATDVYFLEYMMEGFQFNRIAQRDFTVRFWVKAAKSGIHCIAFRNTAADRSYVVEYTVSNANTWEEKTITIPASPSGGTWDYTNGIGLRIAFPLAAGSNFQTGTPNTWVSASAIATANHVNELDSTSNNFRVGGLTINPGSYCPSYVARPYLLEDFLCRRYSEVFGGAANSFFAEGYVEGTTKLNCKIPIIPKRTGTLSVGALSGTIGNISVIVAAGAAALTSIGILSSDNQCVFAQALVASGLTAGQGGALYAPGTEKLYVRARM